MTICVLGAAGMLGSALTRELEKLQWDAVCYSKQGLDITDELSVRKLFKRKPSIIINCAAVTNVDWCEENPKFAYRINTEAVIRLADLCEKNSVKLIHIGTDLVFNGELSRAYTEEDFPAPIQVYGRSKLSAERHVLRTGGIVFRAQWIYGSGRKNFTDWVIDSVMDGKKIPISVDQMGVPSSAEWLAKQILYLMVKLSNPGVYHVSHDDWCTRYEFAEYIARTLGKDPELCFEKMSGVNFGPAKRPICTILGNQKIKSMAQLAFLGSWKTDIKNYIENSRELTFNEV